MNEALRETRITSVEIDDELRKHLDALGALSVTRYKLWCYRHGLSTDLHKDEYQRRDEVELYERLRPKPDPDAGEDHDPVRAELLRRLFRGEFQNEPLPDIPSRVRKLYRALDDMPDTRPAFERLVLHTERHSRFFRPKPMVKRWGNGMANTCIAGLEQLARHHRDWCRPIEGWRPVDFKQRFQFSSLARYLLAEYDVPLVMDSAWFQGNSAEALRQQDWFKHVGFGKNIRTAGVPMVITKRMAHLFSQENGRHGTLIQALRRVQVAALGGDMRLPWAIASSQLGRSLENEAFWISVIHFFVNNYPMLATTYIDPMIDYIRHRKYEIERVVGLDGRMEERPPPQPNFTMKGRSADKLLRQVDEWHAQLSGMENMPLKTWKPCGLRPFHFREVDPVMNRRVEWSIQELLTSAQLGVEGRTMHHCIGSYSDRCVSGEVSVWSMQIVDLEAEEPDPMHILTIAINPYGRTIIDARGKYNLKPFDKKRTGKKRSAGGLYLRFLRESARIMRLWMDLEGIIHG